MFEEMEAVYFEFKDYASTPRRLTAFFVDVLAAILLCYAVGILITHLAFPSEVLKSASDEEKRTIAKYLLYCWIGLGVAYHILLRKTRGGTVGYRLAGIRMVNAFGRPPTFSALIKRFLVALPACLFFLLAYVPCRNHPKRQAFHDQVAGTWLVRRSAEPAGAAQLSKLPSLYGVYPFAFMLTHLDVKPKDEGSGE